MAGSRSTSPSRTASPPGQSAGRRQLVSWSARRTRPSSPRCAARCPDAPILLPGIGAQAGDLEASLRSGLDSRGLGLIVSASRSVIYAGKDHEGDWTVAVRAAALRASRRHQWRSGRSSRSDMPCRARYAPGASNPSLITRSTARVR